MTRHNRRIWMLSVVMLVFADYTIVLPEKFRPLERFVAQAVQVGVIHIAARRLQGTAISNHKAAGGALFSPWRAVGIAILLIPVNLAILHLVAILFPELPDLRDAA